MKSHPHYTRWPLVEGYCQAQSYRAGERIEVCCASRASRFSVEVARVGAKRSVVWSRDGLTAADHSVPDEAWATGCDWPVAFTIDSETSWPSGFYEIRFIAEATSEPGADQKRAEAEAFFMLRPAAGATPKPSVLVVSTNTYNAYNQWGGRCLYSGAECVSFARPIERGYLRRAAAPFEVPFDGRVTNVAEPSDPEHRQLVDYQASHDFPLWSASSGWHNWERRFVAWAEAAGYEFDYITNANLDAEVGPGLACLEGHRLLVSVGHDEYWSWGMRDTIDEWVDGGGNLAVFGGNTSFWQVRYEDQGQTMVCYKGQARTEDPVRGGDRENRLTSMWSDPLIGRPETTTIGLTFSRGGYHRIGNAVPRGSGAYTIARPDHWAFAGTDLRRGDQLGAGSYVVGYEVDGCAFTLVNGLPVPTGEDGAPDGLTILATSPARLISITEDRCEAPEALWASVEPPGDLEGVAMVLYGDASPDNVAKVAAGNATIASFTKGEGNVFNAGSADWAYGLDADPLVQRVTANVLDRFGAAS